MGIVLRQGSLNTAILFAGIAIGFVNEVVLLRNFLQREEVGLIKVLIQASTLFVQLASLGGMNMMLRFFPRFRDAATDHGGILFGILAIVNSCFAVVALGIWVLRDPISSFYAERAALFVDYMGLLFPLILFTLNFLVLEAYARSNYRTVAPVFFKEVGVRLGIALLVSLYAFGAIDIHAFYLLFTAVNCAVAVALAAWLIGVGEFRVRPVWDFFRGARFREMLGYGLITMPSAFSQRLYASIDSLMIAAMLVDGLAEYAVYAMGVYLASVLMAPGRAIHRIAGPLVADAWKRNDRAALAELYRKVSLNNLIACGLIFLAIWGAAGALFSLIEDDTYRGAITIFLILGAGRIFDMATGLNGVIILTSDRFRWILVFNVATGILACGLNYVLIGRLGIQGAALATAGTILVANFAKLLFVYWSWKLFPFTRSTLAVLVFGAVAGGVIHFLPSLGSVGIMLWVDAAVRTLLAAGLFIGATVATGQSEDITAALGRMRKRFAGRNYP